MGSKVNLSGVRGTNGLKASVSVHGNTHKPTSVTTFHGIESGSTQSGKNRTGNVGSPSTKQTGPGQHHHPNQE